MVRCQALAKSEMVTPARTRAAGALSIIASLLFLLTGSVAADVYLVAAHAGGRSDALTALVILWSVAGLFFGVLAVAAPSAGASAVLVIQTGMLVAFWGATLLDITDVAHPRGGIDLLLLLYPVQAPLSLLSAVAMWQWLRRWPRDR